MKEFQDLIRTARINKQNDLSVRGLADLVKQGGIATVTGAMVNAIELGKPCSFKLAYALAIALDLDVEQAMRAAFLARVRHSVKRQQDSLDDFISTLPKKQRPGMKNITHIPSRLM